MTTLAAHQPNLLPWLGYLDKIDRSDVFVWLDDVQFVRRTYLTRVDISVRGRRQTLTIPVRKPPRQTSSILEIELDQRSPQWAKHWRTLELAYGHAPGWPSVREALGEAFAAPPPSLVDFNLHAQQILWRAVGLPVGQSARAVRQSELQPRVLGVQSERLAGLCRRLDADIYLSGGHQPASHPPPERTGTAADYNDPAMYAAHGAQLQYQNFSPPAYTTPYGPAAAGLSTLDAICWLGGDQVLPLLRRQRA